MKKTRFNFLDYLILLFRTILFPFSNIILPLFFGKIKKRLEFEKKNLIDPKAVSFRKDNLKARYSFEVSSEGELEQVYPLLELFLSNGHLVEILYCSQSVERNINKLTQKFSNLRALRLPLINSSVFPLFGQNILEWVTGDILFLCRYDFFPELLIIARNKKSILLEATIKGKTSLNFYKKLIYRSFDYVYTSTKTDAIKLKQLCNLSHCEFLELRFLRIAKRKVEIEDTLNNYIVKNYYNWLRTTKIKKIIFGSFWPNEMYLFDNDDFKKKILNNEIHITIFPHEIDQPNILNIVKRLKSILGDDVKVAICEESNIHWWKETENYSITIMAVKGFLCEFYALFDDIYVGGGFGRSVHSLLEVFTGTGRIYCGPKTYRSTEYDIIHDMDAKSITVINEQKDFYNAYSKNSYNISSQIRTQLIDDQKLIFNQFYNGVLTTI